MIIYIEIENRLDIQIQNARIVKIKKLAKNKYKIKLQLDSNLLQLFISFFGFVFIF